jgi:hypothetical protein
MVDVNREEEEGLTRLPSRRSGQGGTRLALPQHGPAGGGERTWLDPGDVTVVVALPALGRPSSRSHRVTSMTGTSRAAIALSGKKREKLRERGPRLARPHGRAVAAAMSSQAVLQSCRGGVGAAAAEQQRREAAVRRGACEWIAARGGVR